MWKYYIIHTDTHTNYIILITNYTHTVTPLHNGNDLVESVDFDLGSRQTFRYDSRYGGDVIFAHEEPLTLKMQRQSEQRGSGKEEVNKGK